MHDLFDDLCARGISAVEELIAERREESLHLEYKQVDNRGSDALTRDDKKRIAKAACGMANAEGGLILVGVASRKAEGLDVADAIVPLTQAATVRSRLVSALPEMLGPQHPGLAVVFIPTRPDTTEGVLAVSVPSSDRRPHMSIPEQRYFRGAARARRSCCTARCET